MPDDTQMVTGGVIGAAITAVFGGAVALYKVMQRDSLKKQSLRFTEQGQIIDRQEKQIARLEAQVQEQQAAINKIQELHAKCREDAAKLRVYLTVLASAMRKAGIAAELPPAEMLDSEHGDAAFIAKTTQQNTALLSAVDKEPPGAK